MNPIETQMATITTSSHGNYTNSSRRQYISVTTFQNDIFQYTTSLNPQTFVTTGTLTSLATVGTGTALTCPVNRILRENGKKLYPPSINAAGTATTTIVGPYPGVNTYMVGVYDVQSGLSGYIDPNSPAFAVYNSDKPTYVPRGLNPNGGAVDQGTPVLTTGAVTAGTTVTGGTGVIATTGQVRANTVTPVTYTATPNIDISLGQVFTMSVTGNAARTASNPSAGAIVYLVITSDAAIRVITGTGIVKMASVSTVAGKITTIGFVSDGTNLYQFSAATQA